MTLRNVQWAAEVEHLQRERDIWKYRASFWIGAVVSAAKRNVNLDYEGGPVGSLVSDIVTGYIWEELEAGHFSADALPEKDSEDQDITLPWETVVAIAAEINVDAAEVLHDFIEHNMDSLGRAVQIAGGKFEKMGPVFAGVPISDDTLHEIMNGHFGKSFQEQFADKYLLHVMHGPNPCQHPYDSAEEAIEGAAIDLQEGVITDILQVTRNGILVLDTFELTNRVDDIRASRYN